jgi:hypothetical protein
MSFHSCWPRCQLVETPSRLNESSARCSLKATSEHLIACKISRSAPMRVTRTLLTMCRRLRKRTMYGAHIRAAGYRLPKVRHIYRPSPFHDRRDLAGNRKPIPFFTVKSYLNLHTQPSSTVVVQHAGPHAPWFKLSRRSSELHQAHGKL